MRSPAYQGCADRSDNFCARQDRFELTVEWRTPDGTSGVARKVETGNEESGLFYFFDPGNWELLVKVLDGCAINQRFWVFTAGTTDVDYLLKVEDRLTGKIRSYWNAPGRPPKRWPTSTPSPPACAAPGAARRRRLARRRQHCRRRSPAPGRRSSCTAAASGWKPTGPISWASRATAARRRWPAPARGCLWFFSPANWEVLVKVLDGCAINGHYWVLAAATTDVGYELRVAEPASGTVRTFRNPVGRASPAQIDLEAFACAR